MGASASDCFTWQCDGVVGVAQEFGDPTAPDVWGCTFRDEQIKEWSFSTPKRLDGVADDVSADCVLFDVPGLQQFKDLDLADSGP